MVDQATSHRAEQLEDVLGHVEGHLSKSDARPSLVDLTMRCLELKTLMEHVAAVPANAESRFATLREKAVKARASMEDSQRHNITLTWTLIDPFLSFRLKPSTIVTYVFAIYDS